MLMEMLKKKNILIGLVAIIAVPIVLGLGIKAYDEMDLRAYRESKRPAIELGKDYETLTKNVHSILKEKKRGDAYALFCPEGGINWRQRKGNEEGFKYSWDKIEQEDFSESTITFDDSDKNYNYQIVVENIKTKDGNTKAREMSVASSGVFGERFKCLNSFGS